MLNLQRQWRSIGSMCLVLSAATLAICSQSTEAGKNGLRPNVVFILADDLGYGELGCYGQTKIKTPNIDRLAKNGLKFTQAYAGNAVCSPSRCVLMTGKHPGHARIRANNSISYLEPDNLTLGKVMKNGGYATGVWGKWGMGNYRKGHPLDLGFDHFLGYMMHQEAHTYYPGFLTQDRGKLELDNNPPVPGHDALRLDEDLNDPKSYARFKGKDYAPDRMNGDLLSWIRANQDKPFFAYYASILPHVALHVPDEDLEPYLAMDWKETPYPGFAKERKGERVGVRGQYGYTPHQTPRAAYAAMITRLDTYVGRVVQLLQELDLEKNTLIILTSDNGTTFLKNEVDYEFFNSNGVLSGLKGHLNEGGVRVPMIAYWPGKVKPGTVTDRVVGFEDVIPTLADIAGSANADTEKTDGISFLKTILGEEQKERPFLYREYAPSKGGGNQFVRMANWKLSRKGKTCELYDLDNDPGEKNNLASSNPERVRSMTAVLDREHVASPYFYLHGVDKP